MSALILEKTPLDPGRITRLVIEAPKSPKKLCPAILLLFELVIKENVFL